MSLTKLSLAGNDLIIPGQGVFGLSHPARGRKNRLPFLTVYSPSTVTVTPELILNVI
jgi:hypothetical protein